MFPSLIFSWLIMAVRPRPYLKQSKNLKILFCDNFRFTEKLQLHPERLLTLPLPSSFNILYSVQFSSVAQSCPTICDPINRSTPGLPVHHQLPEFIQTHVNQASDAIQPSHPRSSPSLPAPNPSQHQSLFQ